MISIKPTNNPTIVKFELDKFIAPKSYEFKNIDEAKNSPLAQKLFYLPFVKTVYISGNFIAIERFSIVEWQDVQDEVAAQIDEFITNGGVIIQEDTTSKINPVTVYGETTPNPSTIKFVANKLLTKIPVECKNSQEASISPLAKELFNFSYVQEVFIDENYVSVTKNSTTSWEDISNEIRNFIKNYIENGGEIINEIELNKNSKQQKQQITHFETLDSTSQQIVNILEEYVKPAVTADGGNILFDSYDSQTKKVKVILQGSCNGCPSSTFTLKNGIENMLKSMLNDNEIIVEALN